MWETWVQSRGQKDPLKKEMATHSSTLPWKIPWMEEPGKLQSMGLQRVAHDWAASLQRRSTEVLTLYKSLSILHFTCSSNPLTPVYLWSPFLFSPLLSALQSFWLLLVLEHGTHSSVLRWLHLLFTFLKFSSVEYLHGLLIYLLQILAHDHFFNKASLITVLKIVLAAPVTFPCCSFSVAHIWHLRVQLLIALLHSSSF